MAIQLVRLTQSLVFIEELHSRLKIGDLNPMDYKRSIQEAESVLNHALEDIEFWIGEEVDAMVQKFDREIASAMNRFCEVDDRNLALTKRMSFRLMDLEVKDKIQKLKRLKAAF